MLDPVSVIRLYTTASLKPDDLTGIPDGHVLVSPVLPPSMSEGGLYVGDANKIPGTAALAYRVERISPVCFPPFDLKQGDVVVLRNAMLEPLHPAMHLLLIGAQHIIAKLRIPEVDVGA
jgi:hypothetical protein